MSMPSSALPPFAIRHLPQVSLDQYNRQFNATTYNAFRDAVREFLPNAQGDLFMNLLIDACLCQCGAVIFRGTAEKLRALLDASGAGEVLLPLMEAHLANFSTPADLSLHLDLNDALINKIARLAQIANGIPGWRARAAYAWLVVAENALRAARSLLITKDQPSYVREKASLVTTHSALALYEMEPPDDEQAR